MRLQMDGGGWQPYPSIWFFLGIEGLANVAEETKNPQKDISRGFLVPFFAISSTLYF